MTAALRWFALATAVFALPAASWAQQSTPAALQNNSEAKAATAKSTPADPVIPATTDAKPVAAEPPAPKTTWSSVHVKGAYIAMTFDDGPSATLTPKLLDLLAAKHIHVTFFVLGELAKKHPEILKRAVAEGHEIGNHSWDHPDLKTKSDEEVRSQLNRTKEAIESAIGKPPIYMRPPYGSLSLAQRKWVHDDLGYKIILWSVDPLDWKRPGAEVVHHRIVEETRDGGIILSHDIHPGTVEAMPATFDELLSKGFKFVTMSELLAMELPPDPKPATTPKSATTAGKTGKATPKATPKPRPPSANMPEKITGAPDAPQ